MRNIGARIRDLGSAVAEPRVAVRAVLGREGAEREEGARLPRLEGHRARGARRFKPRNFMILTKDTIE